MESDNAFISNVTHKLEVTAVTAHNEVNVIRLNK